MSLIDISQFRNAAALAAMSSDERSVAEAEERAKQAANGLRDSLHRKNGQWHIDLHDTANGLVRLLSGVRKLAGDIGEPITIHAPVVLPETSTVYYNFTRTIHGSTATHALWDMSASYHNEASHVSFEFGKTPLGRRWNMMTANASPAALRRYQLAIRL